MECPIVWRHWTCIKKIIFNLQSLKFLNLSKFRNITLISLDSFVPIDISVCLPFQKQHLLFQISSNILCLMISKLLEQFFTKFWQESRIQILMFIGLYFICSISSLLCFSMKNGCHITRSLDRILMRTCILSRIL